MMGHKLWEMTLNLYEQDKTGLYAMRIFGELKDGSRNVSFVVCNTIVRPIIIARGCPDCHGQPHTRGTSPAGFLEEVKNRDVKV